MLTFAQYANKYPEIRMEPDWREELPEKPSRVFLGSTMELFGDWVERDWMHLIFAKILSRPQHTFIFLTKKPENLVREIFPENCWVGASATNFEQFGIGLMHLQDVKAQVKFFSFEPLLHEIAPDKKYAGYNSDLMALDLKNTCISWAIIGAQTPYSPKTAPKISWVRYIVSAADKAGVPVFLKDNLEPLINSAILWSWAYDGNGNLRQEFPIDSKVDVKSKEHVDG